jgi:UrcA family protein
MTKPFIATLLAFAATPALAEPPATVSSTVQIADLDLSSADGQRKLDRRLSIAAKEVCGTASPADLAGQNEVNRCFKEILARAADERDRRIAAASNQPIQVASSR